MLDHSLAFAKRVPWPIRSVILLPWLILLLSCRSEKSPDPQLKSTPSAGEELADKSVLVEWNRIKRGMIEEILERSAPLEAEEEVQVLARTQNPAIELLVEEGDKVTKRQILLRLENDRQKTEYDQAQTQLEKTRFDFETQESLFLDNLISESDYRNAKFAFEQARLQAENAKRQLEYTEVRAPISGTITSRMVKVGDTVSTGTPIFEIINLESTVAVIHVPEHFLPKLRAGMEARLVSSTLNDGIFPGFVKRIAPIVEARAGTIKVVVRPNEIGPLRPGMWVNVELVLDSKQDALLIPKRAIVYDNDQTYAFKVYTDTNGFKRAKRELVVPRNMDKENIEPIGGFEAGDLIVVAGQSGLKNNSLVRKLEKSTGSDLPPDASIARAKTNSVDTLKESSPQDVN